MPGLARSFRTLARNLGRVGAGSDSFASPQTIQPQVDADLYSPLPAYGIWTTAVALPGALNVWRLDLTPRLGTTLSRVFVQNVTSVVPTSAQMFAWVTAESFAYTGAAIPPVPLTEAPPSLVQVEYTAAVPLVTRPANSPFLSFLASGIIELPEVVGPNRLILEGSILNQRIFLTVWWKEAAPIT